MTMKPFFEGREDGAEMTVSGWGTIIIDEI